MTFFVQPIYYITISLPLKSDSSLGIVTSVIILEFIVQLNIVNNLL